MVIRPKSFPWDYVSETVTEIYVISCYPMNDEEDEPLAAATTLEEALAALPRLAKERGIFITPGFSTLTISKLERPTR